LAINPYFLATLEIASNPSHCVTPAKTPICITSATIRSGFLPRFRKHHRGVNVHLHYKRHDQVYEDVIGNVVDLGLVAYPTRNSGLRIVRLPRDLWCWFVTLSINLPN
jgi:DNA-binding transcriptional LysR family regulator